MNNKVKKPVTRTNDLSGNIADYEVIDRCLVISLKQELDHHCAQYIREKSDYIIDKRHIKNIIFDFAHVGFMDSSGIGVIMGRYKRVVFTGGAVGVTNIGSSVDRIFRLSGLYKIVKKYDTKEDGLKELRVV